MRTHDTSHHPKHVTHEDVIGSERNASASGNDDGQMTFPQVHPHGSTYLPSTVDPDREDFDEEHLNGAPC